MLLGFEQAHECFGKLGRVMGADNPNLKHQIKERKVKKKLLPRLFNTPERQTLPPESDSFVSNLRIRLSVAFALRGKIAASAGN
jgi:hypothetical protein